MPADVLIRQLQARWRWGAGTPEGVVAAPAGIAFLRSDGGSETTLYVKEADDVGGDETLGWVAIGTAGGGGPPTGPAGGVLAGVYPNPSFAADMATQAELDAALLDLRNPLYVHHNAGAALSGHRLVIEQPAGTVIYADNATLGDLNLPVWMTTGAVLSGADAKLLVLGEYVEGSWAWTPGAPIYLGAGGLMTQTVPTAPGASFLLQVALAISATSLFFNPKLPILLT